MMSQFEFIFTLYSLLLGLSLVELLSGLGRTVKARLHVDETVADAFKIGWLTPLLGLFVMLDLLSFWSAAWSVRDMIEAQPDLNTVFVDVLEASHTECKTKAGDNIHMEDSWYEALADVFVQALSTKC